MTAPIIAIVVVIIMMTILSALNVVRFGLISQDCHAPATIEWPLRRITTEADI